MIIVGVQFNGNKNQTSYEPAFKNATYWSNEKHWNWATKPNRREKASFLSENILPMQESGQLKFVGDPKEYFSTANELDFWNIFCRWTYGKTNDPTYGL